MAGSSVGAMVVGTVFIMVFGMATVTLVESVDQSVKNADYKLPNPEVVIVSVTDKAESDGPVNSLSVDAAGSGYATGGTCATSGGGGTGLVVSVAQTAGAVDSISVVQAGSGYAVGATITISGCGNGDATGTVDTIHDQNTITILNTGSETVELEHIWITLSDEDGVGATQKQGEPFKFTNHYSGTSFLFPGEEVSSLSFPLDSTTHGFNIDEDPDRAFLAIYNHNDAITVSIT